jgi:hypothetical protein
MRRFFKRPSTMIGTCAGVVVICLTGIAVAIRAFDSTPASPSVDGVESQEK